MNDGPPPQEGLDRNYPPLRPKHPVALLETDVVDEDLPKALGGVDDVDRAPPILLGHHRCLQEAGIGFLPHRGEDFYMVIDASKLIGNLDETELGEIPHIWRELSSDARARLDTLDVLVEVLVDSVDEDGDRGRDRSKKGHKPPVGIGGTALKVTRVEVEETHEMVDDAAQMVISDQDCQLRANPQAPGLSQVLESGHGNRRQP